MTSSRIGYRIGATWLLVTTAWACGGDAPDDAVIVDDGMAVLDAWTRPTPAGAAEAAFYVTVENRDAPDDRLIGAGAERCMVVTPHVTRFDDDVASMTDAEADELGLPGGGRVDMAPNGLHLMCLGLDAPLVAGETVEVELRFSVHDPVRAPVTVEQR